jgi:hypothetical protein
MDWNSCRGGEIIAASEGEDAQKNVRSVRRIHQALKRSVATHSKERFVPLGNGSAND